MSVLFADAPMIAAHDLVAMLKRHYLPESRPAAGIFAAEIGSPDGRRRADAIWAPWGVAGEGIVGHEVKVSRSDVIAELADPMKADPWARYCSRWWLVVPAPQLLDGLSIPDAWGVMSPPSGRKRRTMTVVREAPRLKPIDTGAAWQRIAVWQYEKDRRLLYEAQVQADYRKREVERLQAELDRIRLEGIGRTDRRATYIGEILTALDRTPGWYRGDLDAAEVAEAIADVEKLRSLARSTAHDIDLLIAEAKRITEPMKYVIPELEQLRKRVPADVRA